MRIAFLLHLLKMFASEAKQKYNPPSGSENKFNPLSLVKTISTPLPIFSTVLPLPVLNGDALSFYSMGVVNKCK